MVEGKEVLEVVKGKQEVRDAGQLGGVKVGTPMVIAVIEVEVGPNLNGRGLLVGGARSSIGTRQLSESAGRSHRVFRADEEDRRSKGAIHQRLGINEGLEAQQVGALGLASAGESPLSRSRAAGDAIRIRRGTYPHVHEVKLPPRRGDAEAVGPCL